MRFIPILLFLSTVAAGDAFGQVATTNTPSADASEAAETASGSRWEFSMTAGSYFVPDDREYVQPTLTADRDWLHVEARYNYEDLETGSLWLGYNFSTGEALTFDCTPMIGAVFGNTTGVAPGARLSLGYWKLELYSEMEYVFDLGDSSDDFFYTWSELSVALVEWFRIGVVIQRTRAYETDVDLQRGLLVGAGYRAIDVTAYVFNLEESQPTLVLSFGIGF